MLFLLKQMCRTFAGQEIPYSHKEYNVRMSISPTSYEQPIHTKVFCTAFMSLKFVFVIFWQKNIGIKTAHKMLVKLTTGNWEIQLQPHHNRSG